MVGTIIRPLELRSTPSQQKKIPALVVGILTVAHHFMALVIKVYLLMVQLNQPAKEILNWLTGQLLEPPKKER